MQERQMLGLHNLVAPRGARQAKKRVGRGESSGHGKTAGRGGKGQKARKSGNVRPGFEGGQVPLARRLPKRGFRNSPFVTVKIETVNLDRIVERFEAGASVDHAALVAAGLVKGTNSKIKVLGNGELTHILKLKVHSISRSAKEKLEKAGGSVELIGNS